MPICFKCGKDLATDQSLQYHLQKRVKCNTLSCNKCKKQFPNKILFDNHKHECEILSEEEIDSFTRHKVYDLVQSSDTFLLETDPNLKIKYISENYESKLNYKKSNILNEHISTLLAKDEFQKLQNQINNNKNTASLFLKEKNIRLNVSIKYQNNAILLIKTVKYKD